MVNIPLYIFLFIYFFFLLTFVAFFLVNIGHLVRTGTFTLASFLVTFGFLAFTAIVSWFTWILLAGTDWQQPLTVWDSGWFGGTPFDQFGP